MSTTLRRSPRLAAQQQKPTQLAAKGKENILCRRSNRLCGKRYNAITALYKQIPDDPRLRSYATTLDFGIAKLHFQLLFDKVQFEKILTEKIKHVRELALFMERDERVHKIVALSPRFRRTSLEKFKDLNEQMPYNPTLKECNAKVQALVERLSTRPDFVPDPFEFN
jgi:hypothetical protein